MIAVSLSQLSCILSGELFSVDQLTAQQLMITDVTIDSRQVKAGSLFIALVGERFDGHDFAQQVIDAGAVALVVNRPLDLAVAQLVVADTHMALGQLACWNRNQVTTHIVALTGSSGKTSVKEMAASILQQRGSVLYTAGNFNNDIGVPLTLLRLTRQHQFAVIELGANHIGEIAYTSAMVRPQAALVNNLAAAHLEGFGSLSGVAQAKGEIFNDLAAPGIAIINQDSNDFNTWQHKLVGKSIWRFSATQVNDVQFYASDINLLPTSTQFRLHSPQGDMAISLPLAGQHTIANALAASALAMAVGADLHDVQQGLALMKPVPGRLFPILLSESQYLLDDSYNANVGSMAAAIHTLSNMPGYRVMVVGDMGELGKHADECHQQIGDLLCQSTVDYVFSVGQLSRHISERSQKGEHLSSKDEVIARLQRLLSEYRHITILIKGSRSAGMEQVVHGLKESNNASLAC